MKIENEINEKLKDFGNFPKILKPPAIEEKIPHGIGDPFQTTSLDMPSLKKLGIHNK